MLSTSCKYALRAVVFIMSRSGNNIKLGIKEIAQEIEANEHTTAKILQLLVKHGLIHSTKGPNGGFYMLNTNKPVYIIDVVRIIDGDDLFFECGLGLKKCTDKKPCPIHFTYQQTRENLYKEFCTISIQQLSDDLVKGFAFLKR